MLSILCAAFLLLQAEDIDKALKTLVEVYAVAEAEAADPISSERVFYEGAIPGMLRRLDPHSVFFDPAQFQQLKELEKSTRKGFGTVVSLLPGRVTILQTMPGTPSARSGLMAGDEILAVNGIDLSRLEVEQLIQLLGQSRQQRASLSVRRRGNMRMLQFSLTPEDVDAPAVERAWEIRPGIAYVRVGSFEAETGKQLWEALEKLGGGNLKGLVLDLRNNPGGLMPAALETAAMFLEPGRRILSIKGRKAETQNVDVPAQLTPYKFPVAVLVNEKSASGSEIVAGALQDHKRGTVIGERTFGKGLVQSVFNLSKGTGLALTTAFYYTPNGRSIQRPLQGALAAPTARAQGEAGGIQPDQVVLPEPTNALRAALELSASLTSFATDFLQRGRKASADAPLPATVLDDFRAWAAQHRIQPSLSEWSRELPWIESRLRQEIVNQSAGVAEGDKVEAERDPVVRAALSVIQK